MCATKNIETTSVEERDGKGDRERESNNKIIMCMRVHMCVCVAQINRFVLRYILDTNCISSENGRKWTQFKYILDTGNFFLRHSVLDTF